MTVNGSGAVYYTTDGSDPRLVGGGINPNATLVDSGVVTTTVFDSGTVWRYNDLGVNLDSANWQGVVFDDSAWASGASELGYGDDPATTISYGSDPSNKHITTYFRHTFVVAQSFDSAILDIFYDDGIAVYVNGSEVGRANLDANSNWQTTANSPVANGVSTEFDISNSLSLGVNTIAVEVHQVAATSSDLTFDAELLLSSMTNGSGGLSLTNSTNVLARAFSGGEWSALRDETFVIPASQSDLRISELHFNPADPTPAEVAAGFVDSDDFEFIELYNPNDANSINLSGVQLSNGVTFAFGDFDLLPGERAVVVEDVDAFMARYGDSATILGQWSGGLSNSGEQVTLLDSSMNEIMSVNYQDNDPWYIATDGFGFSLVLEDPVNTPVDELGKYYSWRASTEFGGTPGESSADPSGIVINEILAHTDAPQ